MRRISNYDWDAPSPGGLTIAALFDESDQGRVHDDLGHFFGANAGHFVAIYDRMRAGPAGMRFIRPSWNWGVFFTGYGWFFYRKHWNLALVGFFGEVAGFFLPDSRLDEIVWLVLPIIANPLYIRLALHKIVLANMLGLRDEARERYLNRHGGTWWLGGTVATLVSLAFLAAGLSVETLRDVASGLTSG